MTPLERLAVLYASGIFAGGIVGAAVFWSVWIAVALVAFTAATALVATLEIGRSASAPASASAASEAEPRPEGWVDRQDGEVKQADRRDIERRARASRES